MTRFKMLKNRKDQNGFSLAELTVGMGVGAIVFALAISFLISFNTSAFRADAKSEVTNKARTTLTAVLKQVSSASTMPTCAQWKNQRAESNPATANIRTDCLELVNGSVALRVAKDNVVCWNKAVNSSGSEILFPEKFSCLYRGASGEFCADLTKTDKDLLYSTECTSSGGSAIVIPGSTKIVAELGPHGPGSNPNLPTRDKLFTYVNYDNSRYDPTTPPFNNTSKILKVNMNAGISYENGGFEDGQKDYSVYKYSSTIQIASVRAFVEMGAYGS